MSDAVILPADAADWLRELLSDFDVLLGDYQRSLVGEPPTSLLDALGVQCWSLSDKDGAA